MLELCLKVQHPKNFESQFQHLTRIPQLDQEEQWLDLVTNTLTIQVSKNIVSMISKYPDIIGTIHLFLLSNDKFDLDYFSRINCVWGFVTKSDHCSSWSNWGILVKCWNCDSKFFGCWTNWTHWNSNNYHWNHYTQYRRTCDWWVWIRLKANKKAFQEFSLASYS